MGPTPMGVWLDDLGRPGASFELLVCAGCGLTEWWVSDAEALKAHRFPPERWLSAARPCSRCSSTSALHLPMLDQVTGMAPIPMAALVDGGRPAASLWTVVCPSCGYAIWRVEDHVAATSRRGPAGSSCRVCHSSDVVLARSLDATVPIRPVERLVEPQAQYVLRFVAMHETTWALYFWGWFMLRICRPCRRVDWLAQGLDQLRPQPRDGIFKIRVGDAAAPTRGPYRP